MESTILKELLKEYERNHLKANQEAEKKKKNLLLQYPGLNEIESELNHYAILTAKSILSAPQNSSCLKDLNNIIEKLKADKKQFFIQNNIPQDYLLPKYNCSICQDTGYIPNSYPSQICSCLKQKIYNLEYNKSNLSNLDTECFENFNIDFYSNNSNKELYNSEISPRENILSIKKICDSFIDNIENPNEKSLLFTGNTGLGKTFISNCIAKEFLSKGKTVLYQTAPILLDSIIDCRFDKNNCDKNIINSIYSVDLLIIDDLGTETLNSMKFTELFNIINNRILTQNTKKTKTIISTNLNLKNLFSIYDERIVSRLIGYYNICRFYGDDIRFKKKNI